jgi:Protein of unknown function (DUF1236)
MRNGLLASAAVLFASIAMALAQTSPPGGGPPPGAGTSQPGQEKGKGPPGALGKDRQGAQQQGREKGKDPLGKGGAGQQKAQEKGKDREDAQQKGREKGKDREDAQQKGREKGKDQPSALGKEGAGQQKGKESKERSEAGKAGEAGSMTPQQRTRIQKTVVARGPKVKNVDFSVNVGTAIPRTVRIVVLPPVFLEVYPQYRGRKYFVYNDQIIIVDNDYKIIAVIDI